MTDRVLISIRGMQVVHDEPVEMPELMTTGTYRLSEQVHQVIYKEQLDDSEEMTTNELLFSEDKVELKKDGQVQTHLIFEKGKKNLTFYHTPYGAMTVEMTANEVEVCDRPDEISIHLEYALAMNEEHMADCALQIQIGAVGA